MASPLAPRSGPSPPRDRAEAHGDSETAPAPGHVGRQWQRGAGGRRGRRVGTGRARGRVTFGPLIADRAAQWEVEVELFIPSLCASVVGGCDGVQSAIRGAIPDSACVTEGGGNCRCAARQGGALRDGDGYASVGNQIVSASLMRRWDYCVEGARLRYRDVSATGAREPGTVELTRR